MGWLDRLDAKKKEQLKGFEGKSDDDILAAIAEAQKAKEEATTLKAKVEEQDKMVTNIQSEFNSVKERLRVAEANQNKPAPKIEPTEPADFVTEPDKAFGERVAPLAQIALQTAATTARMLAQQQLNNMDSMNKTMDGRLFAMWSVDIDGYAKKYQLIQLGQVDTWLGIFYYLKGIRADELANPEIRKKKYNFLESAASTSASQTQQDGPKKTGAESLTEAEKHVADKMGVSYENYAKRKEKMQFVTV